ncbi:hypothetical protein, partial [Rhizobium leguminosarum]
QVGATASMELDTADHRRSSGVTSGLHRMLTLYLAGVVMLVTDNDPPRKIGLVWQGPGRLAHVR